MKYQSVAKIVFQTEHVLQYQVISKSSKPRKFHRVTFKTNGTRNCKCVGHEWLQKKVDDILKDCRHKKLVTIYTTILGKSTRIYVMKNETLKILKNQNNDISAAWGNIKCMFPNKYNPTALYCTGCPLYPEVCNIHKIMIPGKRNKLPLVWKLQGQIFNNDRTAAAKTLRQIIKKIELQEANTVPFGWK